MSTNQSDELNISKEFIAECIKQSAPNNKRKGGRYTNRQRIIRREKVFKLYVEYGYPISKISEMLRVNRNTINSDINEIDRKITLEYEKTPLGAVVMKQIHRMEARRTRLAEELQKHDDLKTRLYIEKFMMEIENKIAIIASRSGSSVSAIIGESVKMANSVAEEYQFGVRWINTAEMLPVIKESKEKIDEIIRQDEILNRKNRYR